jgi:hypothetical protein
MPDDPKDEKDKPVRRPNPGWFQPGHSGNPAGKIPGQKNHKGRVLSKLNQIWMRTDAPDNWFTNGLDYLSKANGNTFQMNIAELIVARQAYCLATNTKYQNSALLAEWYNRSEGKIPLRVLHKPGEEDADELDDLTSEELKAYLQDIDRRVQEAASDEEDKDKQLTDAGTETEINQS